MEAAHSFRFMVTMLSVMGPATLMSTDHAYGWDRLSLTLPVSRRDIGEQQV